MDRMGQRVGMMMCLAASLLGCSRLGPADAVPVFPVSGCLKFQGKPMSGAVVTFHHVGSRLSAQGIADASGNYSLTTYLTNDGAVRGEHAVTIHWPEENSPPNSDDLDRPLPPDRLRDAFTNAKATTLRSTVLQQPNVVNFTLPAAENLP